MLNFSFGILLNVIFMKRIVLFWFLVLSTFLGQSQTCSFDFIQSDTNFHSTIEQNEKIIKEWKQKNSFPLQNRNTITIPVVFHILWHKEEENISNQQIQTQIEILNRDYNSENIELSFIPDEHLASATNANISFCIATKFDGTNLIEGISRKHIDQESINVNQLYFSDSGGDDAWNTKKYLNIWVCKLPSGLLGFATMPNSVEPYKDGIVIDYRNVGSIGSATENTPYHLGRTLTHEVGHYLNLLHPWGKQQGECEEDDLVDDTPVQAFSNPNCNLDAHSCGSLDNHWNFMGYADDACMAFFTEGQKSRMLECLVALRPQLLDTECCSNAIHRPFLDETSIAIFPNPAKTTFSVFIDDTLEDKTLFQLELYNQIGEKIMERQEIKTNSFYTFDFPQHISSGIYFLLINNNESSIIKKLTKI